MKSNQGFALSEALVCLALCSVLCLWSTAVMKMTQKNKELMKSFEEEINQTWEEIYASLSDCSGCLVTEEDKEEY